jgi:RimJ/RimL family protein N-acetyltransferase
VIETLGTERLLLRPFAPDDLPALTGLCGEESFWWYGLRRAMTPQETEEFLARITAPYEGPDPALHAVVERSTGSLVGYAGLSVPHFLPEVLPAVEVGWRLGEAFRGRGYATEAGAAALEWGFTTLGLERIISIYEPANTASGKVMDRLGFAAGRPTTHPKQRFPLLVRTLTIEQWRQRHADAGSATAGGNGRGRG